jgi:hypothetical protein
MQKRYHLLGFDDNEISTTLVIDIGRFLGFRKPVDSDSWQFAGDAFILKMFCEKLFSDCGGGPTPSFQENTNSEDEEEDVYQDLIDTGVEPQPGDVLTVWSSTSNTAKLIRLCTLKTWSDYLLPRDDQGKFRNRWNEKLMLEQVDQAVNLYEECCRKPEWADIKPKLVDRTTTIASIRETATNWRNKVVSNAKEKGSPPLPAGTWFIEILTTQSRSQFADYYNCILRDAKANGPPSKLNRQSSTGSEPERNTRPRYESSLSNSSTAATSTPESNELASRLGRANTTVTQVNDLISKAETWHEESLSVSNNFSNSINELNSTMKTLVSILLHQQHNQQPNTASNYATSNQNQAQNCGNRQSFPQINYY